jgi:hypothetical protein
MDIMEMVINGVSETANKTFISAIVTIALFFGFVTLIS